MQYLNLLDPVRKPEKPKPSALLKLGYKDLALDEYERQSTHLECGTINRAHLVSQDRSHRR